MLPRVLRNDVVKAHIVLHADIAHWLHSDDATQANIAIYVLAHEAAHVHDLERFDRVLPGIIVRQSHGNVEQTLLFQAAEACWDEYAACRHSAKIYPEQEAHLEKTFCDALNSAKARADDALRSYRIHRDPTRVFAVLYPEYSSLLKYAAYLLGHVQGLNTTLQGAAQRVHETLDTTGNFTQRSQELSACLESRWRTREQWHGITAFEPLKGIVRATLQGGGVYLSTVPQGLCIRVNFPTS